VILSTTYRGASRSHALSEAAAYVVCLRRNVIGDFGGCVTHPITSATRPMTEHAPGVSATARGQHQRNASADSGAEEKCPDSGLFSLDHHEWFTFKIIISHRYLFPVFVVFGLAAATDFFATGFAGEAALVAGFGIAAFADAGFDVTGAGIDAACAVPAASFLEAATRRCRGMISAAVMISPRVMMTARSTAFFSSRTLPGQ
jgi:hypothetical protein